jgi:hypothetical protein
MKSIINTAIYFFVQIWIPTYTIYQFIDVFLSRTAVAATTGAVYRRANTS